jgi:hypothetical protein
MRWISIGRVRSVLWHVVRSALLKTPLRRTLLTASDEWDFDGFADLAADVERAGGAEVAYDRPQPIHSFLRYVSAQGNVLFHGTGNGDIREFRPRRQTDYDGSWVDAVFATSDPVWPLFFAVVNRRQARSLINACLPTDHATYYYFSVSADPRAPETWRDGWVYVLPRASFVQHRARSEWMSRVPVRPLARLHVTPSDFPFLDEVVEHERGEAILRVVARATVLRGRAR